jgi:hypothetical protein
MITVFLLFVFLVPVLGRAHRPAVAQETSDEPVISDSEPANTYESCVKQFFGEEGEPDVCDRITVTENGSCKIDMDVGCRKMNKCRALVAARNDACLSADTGFAGDGEFYCHVVHDQQCEDERRDVDTIAKFVRGYAGAAWNAIANWQRSPPPVEKK